MMNEKLIWILEDMLSMIEKGYDADQAAMIRNDIKELQDSL